MDSCKALALRNGLTWGGSGPVPKVARYHGCYATSYNRKAYFGDGGTKDQKMQNLPPSGTRLRLSSLDTDCLLLSNQATLFQLIHGPEPKCRDFSRDTCPTSNGCYRYVYTYNGVRVECAGAWEWRPN